MSAEDRLTQLVRDAAESVDPGERLGAIRARAGAEAARKRRRVWWTVGGASLATAAAVAVVAVAAGVPGAERADEPGPAGSPTDIPSGTFTLEATPSAGPSPISPPWRSRSRSTWSATRQRALACIGSSSPVAATTSPPRPPGARSRARLWIPTTAPAGPTGARS